MTTFTCLAAILLAVLTVPVLLLLYATESRTARIKRMRSNGYTWKAIGARYGVTESTPRKWLTTAAAKA
jgi:hypothetical protein